MINCQLAIEQRRKQPIHHFTWLFTIDANHSANKPLKNNQIDKFAVKTDKAAVLPGNISNSCLPVVVSKANSLTWIPNSQRTRQSCLVKWTRISEEFRCVKASNTHQRQISMASSSWHFNTTVSPRTRNIYHSHVQSDDLSVLVVPLTVVDS